MREQSIEKLIKINDEKDLITRYIDIMCSTDDNFVLLKFKEHAIRRIENIYNINYSRLAEKEGSNA